MRVIRLDALRGNAQGVRDIGVERIQRRLLTRARHFEVRRIEVAVFVFCGEMGYCGVAVAAHRIDNRGNRRRHLARLRRIARQQLRQPRIKLRISGIEQCNRHRLS